MSLWKFPAKKLFLGTPNQQNDSADLEEENPKKRPKWWHNTIGDVWLDEMRVEGRPRRGKKSNTVNYALMANIQDLYEPQEYEEAKGRLKWEKAMQVKHETL
jgi:hypothetical protein